jgi:hypothetical protein
LLIEAQLIALQQNYSNGNFKAPVLYVAPLAMYGILDADEFVDGAECVTVDRTGRKKS